MNIKEFIEECNKDANKQIQIMNNYRTLGFVKNNKDEEGLHMYYSPYKVPENLTKIGVRRAINKYFKSGSKNKIPLFPNRITILFNDKPILGASINADMPKNHKELVKLIKMIIK